MAQWGQGQQQGFQYPMQTGFPAGNPQFQQNPQFVPQNQQFQQQPQFQPQGGLGAPNGGLIPQRTGFPGQQQPQGFQQPQQTGFQQPQQTGFAGGSGFMQPQATGFPAGNFQQNRSAPPPPVPPIPSQFQQPNQTHSFLNAPPPNRLLSASPGYGGGGLLPQATGFAGRPAGGPLVPQMTGFVDPRIMMMTQTFMPTNTSAPYGPGGVPQLPQQQQNLVTSIQQHNQAQRGSTQQQISWALSKAEKKNYNNIFRSWDAQNTGFIGGPTALEVFGASGLPKDDLARIWTLADGDDRGKLNLAEFHVAMGLIYRRLNGMPVPDVLPAELRPPSAKDLDDSVDLVKDLLKHETRSRSPLSEDSRTSYLKNRSFTGTSALDTKRDATIYRHNDNEPATHVYQSRNRHVDRNAIRARDDDSPSSDLQDMKRRLENTAQMLDRAAEAEASKTKEDEELDQEMDDLKYRVKRVQDDLDYVARGPRTAARDEEKRRLERELLSLMHERIPEVERKIKARDERKERERRQWARDRDRANERFGRYDSKDDYARNDDRDRPYSRGGGYDDRDRPYSRGGDDRDRPYSRGYDDRDRPRSRANYDRDGRDDRDRNRDDYLRDRPASRGDSRRDAEYDRPRSPPRAAPPPPAAPPASAVREAPAAPPQSTPSPSLKNMSAAERSAFLKAEAARRIQGRMAALGVTAPPSPVVDTSVEDRLQQEKKEAEEKAKAAEKQAEERERARKERLANEKALQEPAPAPAPTPTYTAPPPAPAPKAAPPPPKPRAPAPPPPRARAPAPAPAAKPRAPVAPPPPAAPEVDPEEEALRAREEALRKAKEERERRFQERLQQLEKEEEEARLEEERYQAKIQEAQAKVVKTPSPPAPAPPVRAAPAPAPPAPAPPAPAPPAPPAPAPPVAAPAQEKSTNPFSRLIKEGATSPPATNGGANPWAPPPAATPRAAPAPSKSPAPPAGKNTYQTASSSFDDDWDDVKEKEDSDGDSSDDEITASREARAKIAQSLFGGILPRPSSAAASAPASSPSTPAPLGGGPPPPPPPPSAPPAPRAPIATVAAPGPSDVSALMSSIQGGMRLKPTKTVDKSAPPVSGRVLGDTAPPAHINAAPRPASPPPPAPVVPDTLPMSNADGDRSSYRQSVGWFADRAADVGSAPPVVQSLPSTVEMDEEEERYEAPVAPVAIPEIHVNEPTAEPTSDLMADIDKSIEHRVRSLYPFEGDGDEDLSFGENLILVANPSKSGGDWWYGKIVSTGKAGLFPKTYVETIIPKKAKAVYTYTAGNGDELPFTEGDTLTIIDTSEEEWWKAEQGGVVFIVPAAYLELVEG